MNALRSFVAVAEQGGVTRAAGVVHLTQSAVSMQIKRLEDALNMPLFERRNRTLILTSSGEQLLSYARRMLDLNDEVWSRMTDQAFEGELTLGLPHDIVYPVIPGILKTAAREFPRIKIHLLSSYTIELHRAFKAGEADIILTTENTLHTGGETIARVPLIFVGAQDGSAWQERPLQLAFPNRCIFRRGVQQSLTDTGIPWENRLESEGSRAVEATVAADLAIHALLAGTSRGDMVEINHNGALPDLGTKDINLYQTGAAASPVIQRLCQLLRNAYGNLHPSVVASPKAA
ncbi:MAG: LysR family transcriptional regulator [Planktomarina sp.]